MAVDKKISQLTSLAQGDVDAALDVLPIVDTSANETKKITVTALVSAGATAGISGAVLTNGTINSTTIGATTPSTGAFTTLSASGNFTLSGGTANGVLYLNGSKVATSGSALTFDGTTFGVTSTWGSNSQLFTNATASNLSGITARYNGANKGYLYFDNSTSLYNLYGEAGISLAFTANAAEGMRLTSTGLGIGTASPATRLEVVGASAGSTVATFTSNETGSTTSLAVFQRSGGAVAAAVKYNASNSPLTIDFGTTTNHGLTFLTNNTERMRLDTSGNLGIGTASPGARLDAYTLNNSSSAYQLSLRNGTGNNNVSAGLVFGFNSTAADPDYLAGIYGLITNRTTRAADLLFSTAATGTLTERARLDSSGNLGLGVTPSAWSSAFGPVIQVKTGSGGGALTGSSTDNFRMFANTFYDGSYKRIGAGYATQYEQASGAHAWYTAGTSTASSAITFTQAMTLDASGNLALGTTSAVGRFTLSDTGTTTEITLRSSGGVGNNNRARIIGGYESGGSDYGGYLAFNTTSSSNVNGERARITAAGNVGIGTSSPQELLSLYKNGNSLMVDIGTNTNSNEVLGGFDWINSYNTNNYNTARIDAYADGATNSAALRFWTASASSTPTERARITAGGFFKASNTGTYASSTDDRHELRSDKNDINVLVGTTSTGSSVVNVYSSFPASPNAGAYHFAAAISGSGYQFTVDADGDVKNTNGSYAAISDLKLKQDIEDAASQWDDIKSVRVRKYRFKRTPDAPLQIGVIAQELEQTSPGLVSEDADRDDENNELGTTTKSVKYSILYMKAIKALQEAMARIEQLEAKVAVLENK